MFFHASCTAPQWRYSTTTSHAHAHARRSRGLVLPLLPVSIRITQSLQIFFHACNTLHTITARETKTKRCPNKRLSTIQKPLATSHARSRGLALPLLPVSPPLLRTQHNLSYKISENREVIHIHYMYRATQCSQQYSTLNSHQSCPPQPRPCSSSPPCLPSAHNTICHNLQMLMFFHTCTALVLSTVLNSHQSCPPQPRPCSSSPPFLSSAPPRAACPSPASAALEGRPSPTELHTRRNCTRH